MSSHRSRCSHHQAEGFEGGIGIHIHDDGFESGGLGDRDPVLDLFLARCGDQDFDFIRAVALEFGESPSSWCVLTTRLESGVLSARRISGERAVERIEAGDDVRL